MSDRPFMKCEDDTIAIAPTIDGPRARAWRLDAEVLRKVAGGNHSIIAGWLVEAPWAHPLWHSYLVSMIHLRAAPGLLPSVIYLDGATHELAVSALDPSVPRTLLLTGGQATLLHPANFAAQMAKDTDDLADAITYSAVSLICMGLLSPDTDFQKDWIKLYGDNMVRRPAGGEV